MTALPTSQTNPLDPVFSGVPVVIPQEGLVNPTWNKWFVDLREKVNVINATLAAWSGIPPVTGLTPGIYGDTTHYPIITVNEFGLVTDVTEQSVSGGGGAPIHVTNVSTSYTVALSDVPASSASRGIIVTNSATNNAISINTFANTSIPVGTDLLVFQSGTGATTFSGLPGVTFVGLTITGGGAGSLGRAIQIATDVWAISGDLAYITGGDPYWADVVSLIHFDGANGSTTFTDVTGRIWTQIGTTTALSTAQYKFGTASLYVGNTGGSGATNGISTGTSTDLDYGTGDFTIEWWEYCTGLTGYQTLYGVGTSAGNFLIQTGNGDGKYIVYVAGTPLLAETSAKTINIWQFHAVVSDGGILRMYRDGVQTASITNGTSLSNPSNTILGAAGNNYPLIGYIDEFRITKGVCRYPGGITFTPPTAPFPNG